MATSRTDQDHVIDVRDRGPGADAAGPTDIPAAGFKEIALRVKDELKADLVSLIAAGVAFKALLSLFPLLIAGISIYGLVVDPATVTEQINAFADSLPESAATIIEEQATSIAEAGRSTLGLALAISVATALWAGSGGVASLIEALNVTYDETESRGFIAKRGLAILLALGAILVGAVLLAAIVVVPPLLEAVDLGLVTTVLAQVARWVLLAAVVAGALAVVYRVGPDRDDPKLEWTSPGAIVATVLWLVGSGLFSWYVSSFGSYNETYGSLAGVVVLMLWLFLSAFIVLLGAEINAEMEKQTAHDTTVGEPERMGNRDADAADTVRAGSSSGEHDGR